MAIYRLLQNDNAFAPETVKAMTSAYESLLRSLRCDRADPITEIIAKKIFEIAQTGERDPERIRTLALKELGIPSAE